MERFAYLDIDGNEHPKSAVDTHHIFPRCKMKGHGEKEWANLFTVPMLKTWHNQGKLALHSQVELAPKPTKEMMYRMRLQHYGDEATNPYDQFLHMNEYVHHIAETAQDPRTLWLAGRIADNLEQQSPFILQGMVTIERVTK
jgi:hypothetical protein